MNSCPFSLFPSFIVRTPSLPWTDRVGVITDECQRDFFDGALFLSSPDFYREKIKAHEFNKEQLRIDITLYKYISRSQTRCTPFGLFAGCSVGYFAADTKIILPEIANYRPCSRLDMSLLSDLIDRLTKQPVIANQLRYFPNDSIYNFGGTLRYVEYIYHQTQRIHRTCSVEHSEYLTTVLHAARSGATIEELAQHIITEQITLEDAKSFIAEIIESQLLKNELEIAVTGEDPLEYLLHRLRSLQNTESYQYSLSRIQDLLHSIDNSIPAEIPTLYNALTQEVEKLDCEYNPKYLIQTDLYKPAQITLNYEIQKELLDIISFLTKYTSYRFSNTPLELFKSAFLERYEQQEMPLAQVLDNDLGLGYPINENQADINRFIDDLRLPTQDPQFTPVILNDALYNKYIAARQKGETEIILDERDLPANADTQGTFPETLQVMCRMLSDSPCQFYIHSVGGTSAANLISRFSHLDPSVYQLVKAITQKESELYPDAIVAEVIHLPAARIGNILFRPILREYEIPYLGHSHLAADQQIPISDLMISIRQDRVHLRSCKLNKEIIPRLTSAHNYVWRSLPIYRFLCDLQSQGLRTNLDFQWGNWANIVDYLPRVTYRGHVLSRQQWRLKTSDLPNAELDDQSLMCAMLELSQRQKLPQQFIIANSDHELLVDLHNPISIRAMFREIGLRPYFSVMEFLFDPIKSPTTPFTNEFIFALHRN
ncbi:MAG: lantibiotic dehydratase family protein [Rikenella sp.]|nr:lantibiotic dehydratase family protein [Rikenella sp.]